MTTVAEKSKNTPVDKKLCDPNRKVASTPVGTLTPLYKGEIVLLTTDGSLWWATDLTDTGWTTAAIGV